MVAPLVAATYPLDKLGDGKSQAFNLWLKEYIFTLLVQPLHLLIYVLLVGSVQDLASQYIIYPLVVLGFMLQAEKILKKFFNFKGEGPNYMGGFVGGAAVMAALNSATKVATGALGGGNKKSGGSSSSNSSDSNTNPRIRKADRNMPDLLEDGSIGTEDNEDDGSRTMPQQEPEPNGYNIFEDDEMGDYYGQDMPDEQDSPDPIPNYTDDNIDDEMEKIESDRFDFQKDPNWIRLNQEKQRREVQRKLIEEQKIADRERRRRERRTKLLEKMNEQDNNKREGKTVKSPKKLPANKKYSLPRIRVKEKFDNLVNNPKVKAGIKTASPYLDSFIKGAAKTGIKAYGAATLGTIGVLAGLASDDYDKVFTYGAAGAIGGAKVADVGMKKALNIPGELKSKQQQLEDEYYKNLYADDPDKYQEYINKKADDAYRRDKGEQKKFKEAFGTKAKDTENGKQEPAWKVAFEQSMKYREYGVTDTDVIISAMKAKVNGVKDDKWDDKQRIAAAKYARNVSNEKDVQTIGERLKEKYGNKITDDKINIQKNLVRKIRKLD